MENSMNLDNVEFYKNSRDEFLRTVSDKICRTCDEPQKNKNKIDYINPLKCECRCKRVEKILAIAADIDVDIKKYINKGKLVF